MEKPGICPQCGGKIEYRSSVTASDEKYRSWKCKKCNVWGREAYDIAFRGHEDVEELTAEMRRREQEQAGAGYDKRFE